MEVRGSGANSLNLSLPMIIFILEMEIHFISLLKIMYGLKCSWHDKNLNQCMRK